MHACVSPPFLLYMFLSSPPEETHVNALTRAQLESLMEKMNPNVVATAASAGDATTLRHFLERCPTEVNSKCSKNQRIGRREGRTGGGLKQVRVTGLAVGGVNIIISGGSIVTRGPGGWKDGRYHNKGHKVWGGGLTDVLV